MEYIIYLVYPVMLTILFTGAVRYDDCEWNDEFFTLSQTKALQGFLALCIMLHHVGQEMCASWQPYPIFKGLEFFVPIGYLCVGVFFFCSGYGLYVSHEKNPDYLSKGFFRKRVLPLIIGYYVTAWLFFISRIIMGEPMDMWKVIGYVTGYRLCNIYAWFALIMPLFYVFFYLCFKNCKKRPILAVSICVFVYTLIGTCINHNDYLMCGQWWWNCVHLFWIGLLFAKKKERFIEWAKKHYKLKVALCIVLFAGAWGLSQMTGFMFSYYGENMGLPMALTVLFRWICLIAEMCTSTLAVLFILLVGMKLKIGNTVLSFFGKITFEFYMIHGLVLEFISYRFCDVTHSIVRVTNVALTVAIVTSLGIVLALGLKKVCHIFDKRS